ncbi:GatB/YqeY domain-containing protein [Candidatus Daviesbacteria bacterium]|nr:GatB/YqeY domain-containing protein [Candidatus Daviesbacteria bacterium]
MLLEELQADLKNAQLARDAVKVSTLRLLLSEVKNKEIEKGNPPAGGLSDDDIISIVQREVKKRKEAAAGFRSGGREESAVREEAELKVLEAYLPAQMGSEELTKLVEETINELGASSLADMGKAIGAVMSKTKGRTDGGTVSNLVREKLSK